MSLKGNKLGDFEELVLLAVLKKCGSNAYGVSIRLTLEEATGRKISIGALYATLDRLERKGFISSREGEPTPERGGRAKRYFTVEGAGLVVLQQTQLARQALLSLVSL